MSSEVATVLETNYQIEVPDNTQNTETTEHNEEDNSDFLWMITEFLDIYADEIVECPWQPGVGMTLSDITLQWHIYITPITIENADLVLMQLKQLLANKLDATDDDLEDEAVVEEVAEEELAAKQNTAETKSTEEKNTPKKLESKVLAYQDNIATPLPSTSPEIIALQLVVQSEVKSKSSPYVSLRTKDIEQLNVIVTPMAEELRAPDTVKPEIPTKPTSNTDSVSENVPIINEPQEPHAVNAPEVVVTSGVNKEKLSAETEFDSQVEDTVVRAQIQQLDVLNIEPVPFAEIEESATLTYAEHLFDEIAETVADCDVETAQVVHDIIETIVILTGESDAAFSNEDAASSEEVADLVRELLDALEIEFKPELVEPVVRLLLGGNIANLENALSEIEDDSDTTSSVASLIAKLKKTLASLSALLNKAYALGRSAISNYGLHIVHANS